MNQLVLMQLAPLVVILCLAAVIDARTRRIPNWLTLGLLAAGLGRAVILGIERGAFFSSMGHAFLGMAVGGALPLMLFMVSALGGGDVKLLAGIGAWLGPGPALVVFLVEAIVGMVIVLIQAACQRRMGALMRNSALIAVNFACASELGLDHVMETGKACRSVNRPLPYAVPVLIATCFVIWMGSSLGR